MRPTITVLLTAYNYERFVGKSIQSALDQDYPSESVQLVVINDGSTDATHQKIQEFIERFPGRITYINKPNGGLRSVINAGLEVATGNYITFLSADDSWPVDSISRRAKFLDANPQAGLVYGDMCMVDDNGVTIAPSFFEHFSVNPTQGRILGRLIRGNCVSGGGMMFRSSLLERVFPLPSYAPWEDWWIAVRTAEITEIAVLPGDPIYYYRKHDNNMNLGSDAAQTANLLFQEVDFVRWMLACVDRTTVSLTDLAFCYARLAGCQPTIAKYLPDAEIKISADSVQAAYALDQHIDQAILNGDFISATHWALKAYALNPSQSRAVPLIKKLQLMDPDAKLPVLDEPKTVKVFADLTHLIDNHQLLQEYTQKLNQDDDVTLVLYYNGSEQQGEALTEQLLELVPANDNGPDMLLYCDANGTQEELISELLCNARLDGELEIYEIIAQALKAAAPSDIIPS